MAGRIKETVILKLYYGRTAHRYKQVLICEHLREPCVESVLNSMVMMMIVSKLFENFTKFSYLGRTVTLCNKCARSDTPTAVKSKVTPSQARLWPREWVEV
jgi:hypothetical protein